MKTIYVSGLWIIHNNSKNTPQHYSSFLNESLRYASKQLLHFFSDDKAIQTAVAQLCREHEITLTLHHITVHQLPTWPLFQNLSKQTNINLTPFSPLHSSRLITKEKVFEHYFIDANSMTNLTSFQQMCAIWTSKIFLVEQVMQQNVAASNYCWMDASVSRFTNRNNSDFSSIKISPNKIHHYSSIMHFFGKQLPLNASVLMGSQTAWKKLIPLYDQQLSTVSKSGFLIDEEIALMMCIQIQPGLFSTIDVTNKRKYIHKVLGKIMFPLNGFILKCLNYNNLLLKP